MTEETSLKGKIVMITGANSGIGKATTLGIAKLGASVVMVCRSRERGEAALTEIKTDSGNPNVELLVADLASQKDIRNLVQQFKGKYQTLDVLINNAGIVLTKRSLTEDGIETQFAVNHLAPFLLTNLLLDILKASAPSRVINVSSGMHKRAKIDFDNLQSEKKYGAFGTYGRSKLALNLFTFELARLLEGTGVTVNALHPGMIRTNLSRDMNWFMRGMFKLMSKNPTKGAETPIFLASSAEVEGVTGRYFAGKKEIRASDESYDEVAAKRIWEISAELTNLSK